MTEKQNTPEIRFEGFTDPWEQRKLGDVATIVGGGTPSTNNDAYWDGDIDWYSPAELGEQVYADRSVRRITQAGYDSCSATLLPAGKTILFTSRAGIGNTAILRRSACTNQGFQSLVVNDDTDVYFVYSMTDRIKKFAEQKASGSTFLEISGKGLAAGEFAFPSKDEQTAIGSMFNQLDSLITLHQCTCPIFYFCAHGSRANFASTPQGQLRVLRYPRPIPKMLVSPSSPVSGVFDTIEGARGCGSSSAIASTPSPSARKNPITSPSLCCRDSLSSP